MAIESIGNTNDEDEIYEDQNLFEKEVCYIPINSDPCYYEMKYYLTHGTASQ